MKKILLNTIKISLSAIISIILAMLLNLDFAYSAGILTILTIQSTKKETILTAIERLLAIIIAMIIAYISFHLLGYHLYAFGIYLLIYIFICQYKKWYSSMAVNSVLITHFITFQSMNIDNIINEILLFIVGVSVGIIMNLHLRQNVNHMNQLKQEADEQIKYILFRMSKRIVNQLDNYDGTCFDQLNILITQAKTISIENENNVIFNNNSFDRKYIKMREHQTQVLYEMYKTIRHMNASYTTAIIISDFLKKISIEYSEENDCKELLEEFSDIDLLMKSTDLPKSRNEFEDRARLFSLMRLIEEFLKVKEEFSMKTNNMIQ